MSVTTDLSHVPGHRNLLLDISEASGALCQVQEIVEEHGIVRLIEALDMGLTLFETDGVVFVPLGSFRIYNEMIERAENGENDSIEVTGRAEPLRAAPT